MGQYLEDSLRHVKFKHPFTCLIAGMTGSGKTYLLRDILKYFKDIILIDTPLLEVVWAYGIWQPLYEEVIPNVKITYIKGLPKEEDLIGAHIIVIDDLMQEASKEVVDLFTKKSHHNNQSVFFITQNFFHKDLRTVSLNSHYLILFKNPRDESQLLSLGRQLSARNPLAFLKVFQEATTGKHSYLVVDCRQDTPTELRYRTNIIPVNGIFSPTVLIPKTRHV
jgi:hypothetical protein